MIRNATVRFPDQQNLLLGVSTQHGITNPILILQQRTDKERLETTTATATKTSLENISSRYLYYFTIIPIRSTCTMWPNYPVTEQVGTKFRLRQRMENLPSCVHVLHKTLNLVISRCCLAEHGEEMHQSLKGTCRAFVFLIKSYCFVTLSLPSL